MSGSIYEGSGTVVIGVGSATPVGQSAVASAAAVRSSVAGFAEHPYMLDARGEPFLVAMASYVEEEPRVVELARMAAREATNVLRSAIRGGQSMSVIVGLPENRPGSRTTLESELEACLGIALEDVTHSPSKVQFLAKGHASGLMAIESGCRQLRDGRATFVLAGGLESYLNADTLEWLDRTDCLHIPENGWGFIPGEAAGFSLLCSSETAAYHHIPVLGKVAAAATSIESNRIYTESICIGQGLTAAVRGVLETLPQGAVIDSTICDQNGEAYGADECGFMLARTSEHFADATDFLTPASCWGDVGAASGPLFVSLATSAANKGYAKGSRTLLWTSSVGGERSAVILETDSFRSENAKWQ